MNEHKHLITAADYKALARPASVHLDDDEVQAFITECEDMHIIPAIGYANFNRAVNSLTFTDVFDETFSASIWLDGGEFVTRECGCDGRTMWCTGLRKTLAYYVYAKMLRADGTMVARAGAMRHNDQYASHVDPNRKQYDDVMNIADRYLAECMEYAKAHSAECNAVRPIKGSRARIKAIG